MVDPVVVYVCAKCQQKVLAARLASAGRLLCCPCDEDRRKFIERYQSQHATG